MVRFSLIIPLSSTGTDEHIARFDETLASVLRNRGESCQIIVVHDGSYDDPYDLAREVDYVDVTGSRGLIDAFNAGVDVARGQWVGLLRPGIQLDENWDELIADAFDDANVGCVSPAIVSTERPGRLVAAGVAINRRLNRTLSAAGKRITPRTVRKARPLGPTCWAAFYRRNLLVALGECDRDLDAHYLDVDLALSLKNLGFECTFCGDCEVILDDDEEIIHESCWAHGRSAQRASVRHAGLEGAVSESGFVSSLLTELLTSPWRPANLKHILGRLSSRRFASTDQHHRELVSILTSQRERLLELESPATRPEICHRRAA